MFPPSFNSHVVRNGSLVYLHLKTKQQTKRNKAKPVFLNKIGTNYIKKQSTPIARLLPVSHLLQLLGEVNEAQL